MGVRGGKVNKSDLGGFGWCLQSVDTDDLLVSRDLYEHESASRDTQRHTQIHCCKHNNIYTQ